jgi:hypothetical protein
MSHKRLTTWQKATALVPLALLSGAWTANLTVTSAASAAQEHGNRLPDGSSVPTQAIKAPASVSLPGEIAPGVPDGAAGSTIAGASTSGIPAVALAAYQRAAQVIDAAAPYCHMQWPLVAAIGRVESNHGRYGGNTLTSKGISVPGIYGIPLDGKNGTAKVLDTDGGQYDHDPIYDRAVGPMQFIPSTWSVVGVDADGDGKRNPQDINDASLATAVYLCSGKENLSTPAGQRAAVFRYNHSQSYVDLVLAIMKAYAAGDYSSVPNSSAAPTTFSPVGSSVPGAGHRKAHAQRGGGAKASGGGRASSGKRSSTGTSGGSTGTTGSAPSAPSTPSTPKSSTNKVTSGVTKTVGGATGGTTQTTDPLAQATSYCKTQLSNAGLLTSTNLDKCVQAYQSGGTAAVTTLINTLKAAKLP